MMVHVWMAGANSKVKKRTLENFMSYAGPRALIIDIEALSSVDRAQKLVLEFLSQRRCYVAVDESTTIKNESKRTEFVVDEVQPLAYIRRILSGLPTPRSPLDIFHQFEFLDRGLLGHGTFTTFSSRYAVEQRVCMVPTEVLRSKLRQRTQPGQLLEVKNGSPLTIDLLGRNDIMEHLTARKIYFPVVKLIKGYQNEAELRDLIAPHSFRVKLEDCYDLPPKIYMQREVKLTSEQQRIYAEMLKNATAELNAGNYVTASSVITRMLRLHQILCGHTKDETGVFHTIPDNRVKELLEITEEHEGKTIIWCCYDYNIRQISAALEKRYGVGSVARFWGGNINTREEEEKRFLNEAQCDYMVSTQSAGGRGRPWSIADLCIYHSSTNNLEHRSQSEERDQAVDKVRSVLSIDLVATGTVDERIIEALSKKIDLATVITGDNYKEWLI
jgi:SNF2 family DNA or RNA helicase